jgi:hypothetical protein
MTITDSAILPVNPQQRRHIFPPLIPSFWVYLQKTLILSRLRFFLTRHLHFQITFVNPVYSVRLKGLRMHVYINHLFRYYNDDFYPSIWKSSTQNSILCNSSIDGLQRNNFLNNYGTKTTTYNYIYLLYYNSSGSFFFRLSPLTIFLPAFDFRPNNIRQAVLHLLFFPPAHENKISGSNP